MIELNRISKHYGRKIALSSLSFVINKGEHVAVIGPSGAGKTSMLNILASMLPADDGEILVDGKPLDSYCDRKSRAQKIGMVRQQFDLVPQLAVIHNVLAGRLSDWSLWKSVLSLLIPQDKGRAIEALDRVGLSDKVFERTSSLSGGEQQRVALARLLVQDPEIILADEPVASLDPARAEDILKMLTRIAAEENQTLVASLHSVDYALKYFSRVIALKDGKLFFDRPVSEVSDTLLAELYSLEGNSQK
ncbi:phosphonate ABC transporter ATP-binding protein [Mesobacillus zeae]|uniref:Phosphonate ABC transporter ATP-binding protein n=2 Tax=Mesobacillus zeae TaxID=1917180 RepID=A0A398B8T4_9BACI|nr:phosphonate ABC transporter ATP-binding protein [Mesobacillus zeae]